MSQTILPATQLAFSNEGTIPSINHNISNYTYLNTTFDSDLQMNIEFSPSEQLELPFNPDPYFLSPYYSTSHTKSSQETAVILGSTQGPSSIPTPAPQTIAHSEWQFNDPEIFTHSTEAGSFKPDPVKKIMDEVNFTPQLTPPRSPADDDRLVGSKQPVAIDFLVMDDQDADQELEDLELPNEISQYLDQAIPDPDQLMQELPLLSPASSNSNDLPVDIFSDMESQSSGGLVNTGIEKCPDESINVPIDQVFSGKIDFVEEPVTPVNSMECSTNKGDQVTVVKSCKANNTIKSGRGRKRKAVGKDREERKREQNAIAAKRYRERQQEKMDQIFQEKMKLEESLATLRRKKQSRMDERNIMLFMVYELAKEKQTLDRFVFPSWLEPLYKKHKEGK